jgi:tRNA dimethylallyltransferase
MSIVAIVIGPTAVGKTEILIRALEGMRAEIISADSRQIYRHMDIGTAKPDPEQRRRVVHHLVDCVDPDEPFDAARYAKMARQAIDDVFGRGGFPVVSGGSGLYVRALLEGFFDGPGADSNLRQNLIEQENIGGRGTLHRRLARIDPDSAERIHPHDLFRTVRALEVFERTGIPLTQWHREGRGQRLPHLSSLVGLYRTRKQLYRRIDERVDAMMAQGLLEEVRGLLARGYSESLAALSTVGYREMMALLGGRISRGEAVSLIKRNTRQYAKRQMTWFGKMKNVLWIDADEAAQTGRKGQLHRILEDLSKERRPTVTAMARSRERMRQTWSWKKDRAVDRPDR